MATVEGAFSVAKQGDMEGHKYYKCIKNLERKKDKSSAQFRLLENDK